MSAGAPQCQAAVDSGTGAGNMRVVVNSGWNQLSTKPRQLWKQSTTQITFRILP